MSRTRLFRASLVEVLAVLTLAVLSPTGAVAAGPPHGIASDDVFVHLQTTPTGDPGRFAFGDVALPFQSPPAAGAKSQTTWRAYNAQVAPPADNGWTPQERDGRYSGWLPGTESFSLDGELSQRDRNEEDFRFARWYHERDPERGPVSPIPEAPMTSLLGLGFAVLFVRMRVARRCRLLPH